MDEEANIYSRHEIENNQSVVVDTSSENENISTKSQLEPGQIDEIIEMGDGFDYDGFQVVRREFFAHTCEPSVCFNNCRIYVNAACLNRFPNVEFVQVLVNRDSKIMAIRPCEESERDSFSWSTISKGKRKPKQITCRLFFAKVFELMEWNPDYRYKLLGKIIHANGEYLIAFDLTATEVYQRIFPEGEKPKSKRTPVFPSGWHDQFGLPYKEHRKAMQVNIFDGYAVYSIKDSTVSSPSIQSDSPDVDTGSQQVIDENEVSYV